MLCEGCQKALKIIPTIKEGALLVESNIFQIYLSMRFEKCFICSALSEWMYPQKKYHGIFADALATLQRKLTPSPKTLILSYSVSIGLRPNQDGIDVFDNVFHIRCKFEEEPEFEPEKQLQFFFSAVEPSQVADNTIKLNLTDHERNDGTVSMKPYRPLRSDTCPYCKDIADETNEARVLDYFENKNVPVEGILCGLELDQSIDARFASDDTESDETWRRIRDWLNICTTSHKECCTRQEAAKQTKYPTRLLDLGLQGEEKDDLRLVLSKEETLEGEYMTLSHCWGNSPIPVTVLTSDNLRSFRKRIVFSSLPKTFQDAVVITRKLGIRYLWIDSLCIIQGGEGSKLDWHREASTMDNVYLYSFLNIGATGAPDGRTGCFRERDYETVFRPVVLKPECKLHCTKYRQPYRLVEETFLQNTLLKEPLLQRGWVFQERFLAPRMLHFGSEQLFWECSEMLVCESYPRHLLSAPPLVSLERLDPERVPGLDKIITPHVGNYRWYHILEEYTSKNLTRGEDKLIALSGVARQYSTRMLHEEGTYWAGIWASNVMQDLLWIVHDKTAHRPSEWRAPSWSWASLDGKIQSPLGGQIFETLLAKIYKAEIELLNPFNEFGAIAAATIPARGRLLTLGWCLRADDTYALVHNGREMKNSLWYPDEPPPIPTDDLLCFALSCGPKGLVGLTLKEGSSDRHLRTGAFKVWPAGEEKEDWIRDTEPFAQLYNLDLDEEDVIELA